MTTIADLEERIANHPHSLAFARLADHYRSSGQVDRAIETCARGVALHPDHCSGHLVLGRCFMDQGNWAGAVEEFTAACRIDPRNLTAIKSLGDICREKGIERKAGDLYRLLLKMDPFNSMLVFLSSTVPGAGKTDLFEIIADINDGTGEQQTSDGAGEPASEVLEAVATVPDVNSIEHVVDEAEPEEFAASVGIEIARNEVGLGREPVQTGEEPIPEPLIEESSRPDFPDGSAISSRLESLFTTEPGPGSDSQTEPADEVETLGVLPATPDAELDERNADLPLVEDEPSGLAFPPEAPAAAEAEPVAVDASVMDEVVVDDSPALFTDDPKHAPGHDPQPVPEIEAKVAEPEALFEPPRSTAAAETAPVAPSPSPVEEEEFPPGYILTPTLAEIYFMQGQVQRGLSIYRRLLSKAPDNILYKQRISEMEKAMSDGAENLLPFGPERGKASRKSNPGAEA